MAFTNKTIAKVIRLMKETEEKYSARPLAIIKMCISNGNKKIGRVMNVSLPPILSCGNCKECKFLCYDIKACNQYPNTVIDARIRNWTILKKDRDEYFARIRNAIERRRRNFYFRWHVSGDIIDLDYLKRVVDIARDYPHLIFWTYTKMYWIVNQYCDIYGKESIPSNLTIMFSEWRGVPMDNPYGFPEFRVVFKGEEEPEGHYCPRNCDVCKAIKRGCVAGETTYCREH